MSTGVWPCAVRGTTMGTDVGPAHRRNSMRDGNRTDRANHRKTGISPNLPTRIFRSPLFAGEATEPSPRYRIRHLGLGQPLTGTSWLNRPYYSGAFGGTWLGYIF